MGEELQFSFRYKKSEEIAERGVELGPIAIGAKSFIAWADKLVASSVVDADADQCCWH